MKVYVYEYDQNQGIEVYTTLEAAMAPRGPEGWHNPNPDRTWWSDDSYGYLHGDCITECELVGG